MPTPTRGTPESNTGVHDATRQAHGPSQPDVRPGQIWAPKFGDSSNYRRRIRIDRVGKAPGWSYDAATCASWWEHRPYPAAVWRISTSVRKTVIRLDRFATGYRLVQDAPATEETTR